MLRRLVPLVVLLFALIAPSADAEQRGTEGQTLTFEVKRGIGPTFVETIDGSARAGEDYEPIARRQVGLMENTVTVKTTDDASPERDEDFVVRFTSTTGASVGEERGVVADNDLPRATIADATADEQAGAVELTVSLTPVDRPVALSYAAVPGSATEGGDFVASSGQLAIPAGASEARLRIALVDDGIDEDPEAFSVRLGATDSAAIGDDGVAQVTVADDDLRAISVGDGSVTELDGANAVVQLPVTLSGPTFRTVSVTYSTIDATARAPVDYLSRLGTVTFAPGQTAASIDLAIVGDDRREPSKIFGVLIGRPSGATIGRAGAVVTIADDDAQPNPDVIPPTMRMTKPRLSGGRAVAVRVTCPRSETRCRGRLSLFALADRTAKARSLRTERRLGMKSYTLAGGQARTLKVTLSRATLAAARASGRLRLRAFAVTSDAADNVDTSQAAATIAFKRRRASRPS